MIIYGRKSRVNHIRTLINREQQLTKDYSKSSWNCNQKDFETANS